MLYQGIIGGGSSPVKPEDLSPVLLWTNPSPNDAFAETSLTLDLSNYTAILVEYGSRVKNQPDCVISGWYCKVIDLPNANSTNKNVIATDNSATVSGRRIWYEPSTKALTIGANYGANESNNQAIPFNIYGVNEYVVEPVVGDLLWTNPNTTTAFTPQKISVDLSNAKGAIIEVMISTSTQIVCSKQLVYKGDGPVGLGYSAGGVAQTRNITSVEANGITFETGYSANTASDTILIPYKIYSIN